VIEVARAGARSLAAHPAFAHLREASLYARTHTAIELAVLGGRLPILGGVPVAGLFLRADESPEVLGAAQVGAAAAPRAEEALRALAKSPERAGPLAPLAAAMRLERHDGLLVRRAELPLTPLVEALTRAIEAALRARD